MKIQRYNEKGFRDDDGVYCFWPDVERIIEAARTVVSGFDNPAIFRRAAD